MDNGGKYKKLVGNSVIFAIGNLGSKLITIIMVPLYTFALNTKEYGSVDLVQTTVSLLLPIITLSVFDAAFRFALDKHANEKKVLSNSLLVNIICAVIAFFFCPLFKFAVGHLYLYVYFIVVLQSFQSLFSEFARAIGHVKVFALNGMISTFITAGCNVVFLVAYDFGVAGYLWSIIISNVVSFIFLVSVLKLWHYFAFKYVDVAFIKVLLKYSIPLIPNAFAWWLNNAASKFFVLYFVGVSANGLYAVANKIPSLLSVFNSIFFQSWQMSAVEEYDSEDRSIFYSNVFNLYTQMLFIITAGILLVIKPVMSIIVAHDFYDAWKLVPFLLMTIVFSSMSGFLGTNYIAAKKTAGIFVTTFLGAILNVFLNWILVPTVGVNGAGFGSMVSFFVIFVVRIIDTSKIIRIRLNLVNFICNNVLVFLQIIVIFYISNLVYMTIALFILFLMLAFVDKKIIISLAKPIIGFAIRKL